MGMKSKIAMLTLAAYAMGGGFAQGGYAQSGQDNPVEPLTDAELHRLRAHRKCAEKERLIAKGHKWFTVEGEQVLALNEKNAIRKYNKAKSTLNYKAL